MTVSSEFAPNARLTTVVNPTSTTAIESVPDMQLAAPIPSGSFRPSGRTSLPTAFTRVQLRQPMKSALPIIIDWRPEDIRRSAEMFFDEPFKDRKYK